MIYLFIGVGGAIGAVSRYALGLWIGENTLHTFPLHTFVINLAGCFVLAFFYTLTTSKLTVHPHFRTSFGTGFVGSFTTFSTFSHETVVLLQSGRYGVALFYIVASLVGGYVLAALGVYLGQCGRVSIQGESE